MKLQVLENVHTAGIYQKVQQCWKSTKVGIWQSAQNVPIWYSVYRAIKEKVQKRKFSITCTRTLLNVITTSHVLSAATGQFCW